MAEEQDRKNEVRVTDRRRSGRPDTGRHGAAGGTPDSTPAEEQSPSLPVEGAPGLSSAEASPEPQTVALDEHLRMQADFANARKQLMKRAAEGAKEARAGIIRRLLPVLDNFEAAIAHGEIGTGVELIYKELKSVLEKEGLQAIVAEGAVFDPRVHEAVDSRESPEVTEAVVTEVYQRGYMLDGRLLRPAMVVVARPAENAAQSREADSTSGSSETEEAR